MKKIMALAAFLLPLISMAHPGHGETEGFTIKHYITEPVHAVVAIIAMAVVIFFLGRNKEIQDVNRKTH